MKAKVVRTDENKIVPVWYDGYQTLYWYDQYTRTDGQESFREYDPARIVRELLDLNADIYVLYAVSQMGDAYYPSRILPQHPALKGRDYVGELTKRLKRAGKRVILYVNWGTSREPHLREIGVDGKFSQKWNTNYYVPCLSSPHQDTIRKVFEEVTELYDCDGMSLDMYMSYELCTCQFCQPHLRRIFGKKGRVTEADIRSDMVRYNRWREEQTGNYLGILNEILAAKGMVQFHNGSSPQYNHCGVGGNEWRKRLDPYVTEVYKFHASVGAKLNNAMKRTSCLLITSTYENFSHAPVSPVEFMHYAASAKGNGGRILGVCGVGAYPDTTTSRRLLENVRKTFEFYKKDKEFYQGANPVGEVGLVYSYETRIHDMKNFPVQKHNFEFFGITRVLQETHIPWNAVIAEVEDSIESFKKYRLLILPAVACLSDRFVENLVAYVKGGGRILVTGEAGLWKTAEVRRKGYPLAEVMGIKHSGLLSESSFYMEDKVDPILLLGRAFKISASGKVLRRFIGPGAKAPVFVTKDILPSDKPSGPMVVKQKFGRGSSVYAACEPGVFYYEYGHYQTRELLESLLAEAYPVSQRRIKAVLPDTVELSVTEQPAKKTPDNPPYQ